MGKGDIAIIILNVVHINAVLIGLQTVDRMNTALRKLKGVKLRRCVLKVPRTLATHWQTVWVKVVELQTF